MTIPLKYQEPSEGSLITIDGQQFATGRGIKAFYLCDTQSGSATFLTDTQVFGDNGYIEVFDNVAIDKDYDFQIESPIIFDGEAFITIPYVLRQLTTNETWNRGLSINIQRVSAGVETTLVSGSTLIQYFRGTGTTLERFFTKTLTIDRTVFKAGDTLRVRIHSPATATANPEYRRLYIGTNPKGIATYILDIDDATTYFSDSSQAVVNMPIKIDI